MGLVRCLAALRLLLAVLFLGLLSPGMPAASAGTLDRVRQAGVLRCSIIANGIGLAVLDQAGNWQGFYPDMCRAVAAAAAGSAANVEFVETDAAGRFDLVRDGTVDVSMTSATWTLQRTASLGIDFPVVYLFDGQGLMIHRSQGARRLEEVRGGTVCVLEGTTTERNLDNWVARTGGAFSIRRLRTLDGAYSAFFNRHCDMITSDRTGLHARRLLNGSNGTDHLILSEMLSKEPLGPMIRAGDRQWFDIVRWVVLAMVLAEEKGLSSRNAADMAVSLKESDDPEISRLLGLAPGMEEAFGLDKGWAARVILQVGNYGEVFERNLGSRSPLGIERGLNALWTRGGLHFAPPLGW